MNCPLCLDQTLEIMHRQGVELDICPKCRGIWLDRGELDRLAADTESSSRPGARATGGERDVEWDRDRKPKQKSKKKRKKSLADRLGDALEDVLDL